MQAQSYVNPTNTGEGTIISRYKVDQSTLNKGIQDLNASEAAKQQAKQKEAADNWKMLEMGDQESIFLEADKQLGDRRQAVHDKYASMIVDGKFDERAKSDFQNEKLQLEKERNLATAYNTAASNYVTQMSENKDLLNMDIVEQSTNDVRNNLYTKDAEGNTIINPEARDTDFKKINQQGDVWNATAVAKSIIDTVPEQMMKDYEKKNGGIETNEVKNQIYELDGEGNIQYENIVDAAGNPTGETRPVMKRNSDFFERSMKSTGVAPVVNDLHKDSLEKYNTALNQLNEEISLATTPEDKQSLMEARERLKADEPNIQDAFYNQFLGGMGKYSKTSDWKRDTNPYALAKYKAGLKQDNSTNRVIFNTYAKAKRGDIKTSGIDTKFTINANGDAVEGGDGRKLEVTETNFAGRDVGKVTNPQTGKAEPRVIQRTLRDPETGNMVVVFNGFDADGEPTEVAKVMDDVSFANLSSQMKGVNLEGAEKERLISRDASEITANPTLTALGQQNIDINKKQKEGRIKEEQRVKETEKLRGIIDEKLEGADADFFSTSFGYDPDKTEEFINTIPALQDKNGKQIEFTFDKDNEEVIVTENGVKGRLEPQEFVKKIKNDYEVSNKVKSESKTAKSSQNIQEIEKELDDETLTAIDDLLK